MLALHSIMMGVSCPFVRCVFCCIEKRPIAVDDQVVIRPMMYVALSYDHRIVDGEQAVTFLKRIKECVEHPSRILLEV